MIIGVLFGDKHTVRDWGLVQDKRPVVSPPEYKGIKVDISGGDGALDLTEVITGGINYHNRRMRFEFTIIEPRRNWHNIYSDILDYLQGQKMRIILDEDLAFFYEGRAWINEWESNRNISTIVIEAEVFPYKMERFSSVEQEEWDVFDFETGISRDYAGLIVTGSLTLVIPTRRMSVCPVFTVEGTMDVVLDGRYYHLPAGINRIPTLIIKEERNTLTFHGHGTVSIDYRGGRL